MENRIRELRENRAWSRVELARRAGVGYAALQKWEDGTNEISLDQAQRVARALGVRIADLVVRHGEPDMMLDKLIANYTSMTSEGRAALVATSAALAAQFPQVASGVSAEKSA